jgi:hypothetical protein
VEQAPHQRLASISIIGRPARKLRAAVRAPRSPREQRLPAGTGWDVPRGHALDRARRARETSSLVRTRWMAARTARNDTTSRHWSETALNISSDLPIMDIDGAMRTTARSA